MKKASASGPKDIGAFRKQLDQEKRKLQNLVSALEGGASAPAAILKAVSEREKVIAHLETQIRAAADSKPALRFEVTPDWIRQQLGDLSGLLRSDVARVKAEFRRLNLALTFTPVEAEPRPHYVVKGQCDLSALVFSFVRPTYNNSNYKSRQTDHWSRRQGASLDWMRGQSVQNRTSFLLGFHIELPSVTATGRWRQVGRMGRV